MLIRQVGRGPVSARVGVRFGLGLGLRTSYRGVAEGTVYSGTDLTAGPTTLDAGTYMG